MKLCLEAPLQYNLTAPRESQRYNQKTSTMFAKVKITSRLLLLPLHYQASLPFVIKVLMNMDLHFSSRQQLTEARALQVQDERKLPSWQPSKNHFIHSLENNGDIWLSKQKPARYRLKVF